MYFKLVLCFFLCLWVQGLRHSHSRACIFRGIINLALAWATPGHPKVNAGEPRKIQGPTRPVDIDICLACLKKYVYICRTTGYPKEYSSVNPPSWLLNCSSTIDLLAHPQKPKIYPKTAYVGHKRFGRVRGLNLWPKVRQTICRRIDKKNSVIYCITVYFIWPKRNW